MELEQFIIPRRQVVGGSGILNMDDGSRLFLKLVIGAIAIGIVVFILSKLGIIQWQLFEERRVKAKWKFLQDIESQVQEFATQVQSLKTQL